MKPQPHNRSTGTGQARRPLKKGVMLLSAVLLVVSAMTLSGFMTTMASVSNRNAETDKQRTRARYMAEGALAKVEQELMQRVAGGEYAENATFYLEYTEDGWNSLFEETGNTALGDHSVPYTIDVVGEPELTTGQDGLQSIVFVLRVTSEATLAGAVARANRLVLARLVPVYQFAVFYDMDLEIWPGPNMVLSGRVHANGDLYVGAGKTLQFNSNYVRATGSYIQDRAHKYDSVDGSQRVEFRRWVENPEDPSEPVEYVLLPRKEDLDALGVTSVSGLDSRFLGQDSNGDGDYDDHGEYAPYTDAVLDLLSEPDFYHGGTGSTLKSGEHYVEAISVPNMNVRSMFTEHPAGGNWEFDSHAGMYQEVASGTGTHNRGLFHEEAGLTVQVAENGTWKVLYDDVDVTSDVSTAFKKDKLADRHQNDDIDVVELDLGKLQNLGYYPDNGLIYLGYNGAKEDNAEVKGFVVTNGSQLKGPLSLVSENSIYVHGDYNTVDKKAASVIADRVSLLSNAWDGSKTLGGSKPSASDTTYNMAVMSGNIESIWGDRLAGGFENLVRFHENWKGVDCTILGSFVALWEPTYARIKNQGSAYSPPTRDFAFDDSYTDLDDLPPYTPCLLQLNSVATW